MVYFIGSTIVATIIWLYIKFCVQPTYAEFGRMSQLIWQGWNFYYKDYGVTSVYKKGENTTYSFSGKWMYNLLMKDRPEQEKEEK